MDVWRLESNSQSVMCPSGSGMVGWEREWLTHRSVFPLFDTAAALESTFPSCSHGPCKAGALKIGMSPPVAKRKYVPSDDRRMRDGSEVSVQMPEQESGFAYA